MKEKIFKACLKSIEQNSFRTFTFAKVSDESGIPLDAMHQHFNSPIEVMIHLFKQIDDHTLKEYTPTEGLSQRDQLFEILMMRLEASEPYKAVLKSFWSDWLVSAPEYPSLLCHGITSMAWMLDATGLNPNGLTGMIRSQGVLGIYLYTLGVWLSDDSEDLGKTMAALDKALVNMEVAAKMVDSLSELKF